MTEILSDNAWYPHIETHRRKTRVTIRDQALAHADEISDPEIREETRRKIEQAIAGLVDTPPSQLEMRRISETILVILEEARQACSEKRNREGLLRKKETIIAESAAHIVEQFAQISRLVVPDAPVDRKTISATGPFVAFAHLRTGSDKHIFSIVPAKSLREKIQRHPRREPKDIFRSKKSRLAYHWPLTRSPQDVQPQELQPTSMRQGWTLPFSDLPSTFQELALCTIRTCSSAKKN